MVLSALKKETKGSKEHGTAARAGIFQGFTPAAADIGVEAPEGFCGARVQKHREYGGGIPPCPVQGLVPVMYEKVSR